MTINVLMWPTMSRRHHVPYAGKCWDYLPYGLNGHHFVTSTCLAPLEGRTNGHRSESGKDIKATVVQWFPQKPKEFFVEEIHQLVCQWNVCFKSMGNIFEGLYSTANKNIQTDFI
jgi:hypothetical protein